MNIIIGSIVLCKIIVSDPDLGELSAKPELGQQEPVVTETIQESQTNNQLNNIVGAIARTPRQESIDSTESRKKEPKYSLITGVVESIKELNYLKEVPEFNKYKYEKEISYIVKTNDFEKILIKSTACGLADNYIVTETQLDEIKKKKKEIEELAEKQKKDNKLVKIGNVNSDDIIKFIPANEKVPKGYVEVVTDPKTHQKMIKAALSSIEKKNPQEIYLDKIEKEQKDIFVKKEEKAPEQKKEVLVEKNVDESKDDLESVDVSSILENEKKEEKKKLEIVKEDIVEPIVEKTVEPIQKNEKVQSVKGKKKIILDDHKEINSSGSLIKDALDFNL